jgi:hypothetical protein
MPLLASARSLRPAAITYVPGRPSVSPISRSASVESPPASAAIAFGGLLLRQRRIGVGIDVDVVGPQPRDRAVDQLARRRRSRDEQQQQAGEQEDAAHHAGAGSPASSARSRARSVSSFSCS